MSASYAAKVIDAVYGVAKTLTSPIPGITLTVFDGLEPAGESDLVLYIGVSDPWDLDNLDSGVTTLTYAALGRGARNEDGTIPCAVLARTGDPSLSATRLAACAVVDSLEVALQQATPQSPWLGVAGALFGDVLTAQLKAARTADGIEVVVVFGVRYRARVT